jgi:hypothetical protein
LNLAAAETGTGRTSVLANLVVDEAVSGDVVVFAADLVLGENARVTGDAVAVGGDVSVAEGAEVGRHVVAVFGTAEVSSQAVVEGRVLSLSSLASFADRSGGSPAPRASAAVRLLAAGGWLMVTTGLAFLFPVRMRYGSWALPPMGYRVPLLGMLVVLTAVAFVVAALGLGPALGVPLIAGLTVLLFSAKAVGLTLISCAVGSAVLRKWLHHPQLISLEVFVGALILLAIRFLPFVGEALWALASVIALGASVVVMSVGSGGSSAQPTHL